MNATVTTPVEHDILILGAGPAGLTAAIYAARAKQRVLVVDTASAGGQMVLSYVVANYPGVESTSGRAISQTMLRQARAFGAEVLTQAELTRVVLDGPRKRIELADGSVHLGRALILAAGGVPRRLGVPGEQRFEGKGISYCATCDGDFFTGRPIAVIGGGNSALEEAVALTRYASQVTVIHEFDRFQAQPWIVEEARRNPKLRFLLAQRVLSFEGDETLQAVTTRDRDAGQEHRIEVDGCFVFIGYQPNTQGFAGQLELNARGEIVTDADLRTSVPGVFAAGDARAKRFRQITTAVSDGTVAALAAVDWIENGGSWREAPPTATPLSAVAARAA